MRKLIAAINLTLDGFCDHTAVIADDELHQHYTDLLRSGDAILYGRITYQLMEYWRTLAEKPSGHKADDEFAAVMDRIPKIVFSRTLKTVDWKSARLARQDLKDEITALKQQQGNDILVGSPSLIAAATKLSLVDEYQLCYHPVILGQGLPLFKEIREKSILSLAKTKTFRSGAVVLYLERTNNS
jgi:dihydrofolate reductase